MPVFIGEEKPRVDVVAIVFVLLAAATAAGRLLYRTRGLETFSVAGSYEAVAHIVVGMLLGAWLVTWRRLWLYLFIAITAVEVIAFITKWGV